MDTLGRIKQLSLEHFAYVKSFRRILHQHPELSFREHETSKRIANELQSIGIPCSSGINGTGVVGVIEGHNPGVTIGIRAELDALPIPEDSGLDYSSLTPNVMHACGHDIHMANLIGVAKVLWSLRSELHGKVLLVFQPGEELLPGGALGVMKSEIFQQNFPDIMLGMHILPDISMGKVGFRSGSYMASGDEVYLTVKGRGGHAALPHTLIDPVLISSHIIVALQQLVSRKCSSAIPSVLSFGKMIANGANNIIPDEVTIEGTFRTLDETWRNDAIGHIHRIAQGIASSMEATCAVEIRKGYPALSNCKPLTELCRTNAAHFLGESEVVELPIRMTTDDFAYYAQKIPSVYFRVGTATPDAQSASLHSGRLIVDDEVLLHSVGLTSWLVLQLMNNAHGESTSAK